MDKNNILKENDILKPAQASKLIGCSEYTIRDMARRKEIPHFKIRSLVCFRQSALLHWIVEQEKANSHGIED